MPFKYDWVLIERFDSITDGKEYKNNYLPKGTYHSNKVTCNICKSADKHLMTKQYIDCNLSECNSDTFTCKVRYMVTFCTTNGSYFIFQLNSHQNEDLNVSSNASYADLDNNEYEMDSDINIKQQSSQSSRETTNVNHPSIDSKRIRELEILVSGKEVMFFEMNQKIQTLESIISEQKSDNESLQKKHKAEMDSLQEKINIKQVELKNTVANYKGIIKAKDVQIGNYILEIEDLKSVFQ